jgi:CRP-like cAMP-binding protein
MRAGSFRLEDTMSGFDQATVRNMLLKALPPEAFALLQSSMEAIDLPIKHEVVKSNATIERVCFIETGLASMVATSPDNEEAEVGHIGYEGMAGAHVLLKAKRTPNRTFMQVAGEGITVPVSELAAMVTAVPAAHELLLNYVFCTEIQLSQSALANARYNVHERLARWLLMCHDRMRTNDLPLTHEFLALMLGVRRSGVTDELHIIEGKGVIKATRGNIRVLDRERLEDIAGGCYGISEAEYERLIGLSVRRRST